MVIQIGDTGLLTPCDFTVRSVMEYKKLRKILLREFNKQLQAVAIASNQVLYNKHGEAPAAFLFNGILFINPRYESANLAILESIDSAERCLSDVTNVHTVKRYNAIIAHYLQLKGESLYPRKQLLIGQEAVVFQHETDHLHGAPIWTKQHQ